MSLGPQIAFVDDIEFQIAPLKTAVGNLNTGSVFFDARLDVAKYPEHPLDSIRLLFLDLYYKNDFDVSIPAQWVQSIIPPNKRYSLVIWSKDTHHEAELIEHLEKIDLAPTYIEAWQKTEFNIVEFDFRKKIEELINKINTVETISQEILYGEIVEIEDNGALINCNLNNEMPTFQVRRFDKDLLKNISDLEIGTIVRIHIYTKPGARLIDIFQERKDMKHLFERPDFFKGLEGNAFFIQG